MKTLRSQFNVVMPRALYTAPDGTTAIVSLNSYDPETHHGHLTCADCEQPSVHYCQGSESRIGDNSRQQPHFKTNPHQKHNEDCDSGKTLIAKRQDSHTEYDQSLGYRFELNMPVISGITNSPQRTLIEYRENASCIVQEKDGIQLRARQPVPIHRLDDFSRHFDHLDPGRIRDSIVVWHDFVIPWNEFFLHGERLKKLAMRLKKDSYEPSPVMAYVHPQKIVHHKKGRNDKRQTQIHCHEIPGTHTAPRICIYNDAATERFQPGQPALVLCAPRLYHISRTDKSILYLNVYDGKNLTNHKFPTKPVADAKLRAGMHA